MEESRLFQQLSTSIPGVNAPQLPKNFPPVLRGCTKDILQLAQSETYSTMTDIINDNLLTEKESYTGTIQEGKN